MERSKSADKDDPLVLRGNRLKASNYWTRAITHECLRPKTWLQCELCNCGHCVPHISYQLLDPKPSFKNASYKSKNTFNLHHPHHRQHIHRHVYNLYRHPSHAFGVAPRVGDTDCHSFGVAPQVGDTDSHTFAVAPTVRPRFCRGPASSAQGCPRVWCGPSSWGYGPPRFWHGPSSWGYGVPRFLRCPSSWGYGLPRFWRGPSRC